MSKRIHYIDQLRVLAVLLLFPFHTGRLFDAGNPFYAKSAMVSSAMSYVLWFIDRWHMPLLFLLAGASTYLAMGKRTGKEYASERVSRLLVPLLFGLLIITPAQGWIGARTNSAYLGSLWTYLSTGRFLDFSKLFVVGDYFGGFVVGHLWFVLYLFLLAMVALPLFVWGRGKGSETMTRWSRRLSRPAWWLLPPFVLLVADALPDIAGKNPFYYLTWLVVGYVAMADESFMESAERFMWPALGGGLLLTVGTLAANGFGATLPDPSLQRAAWVYVVMAGAWLLVVACLGLGRRYLDRMTRPLPYLAESSYPVYILHQTVIVLVGYAVLGLGLPGVAAPYALTLAASVAITFALYEGVRRIGALRFLFGMRRRPVEAVGPVQAS
jgi:glucans biosynthesis protein C